MENRKSETTTPQRKCEDCAMCLKGVRILAYHCCLMDELVEPDDCCEDFMSKED